ncbi:calcium/proton exchanger [Klebsiella pneumoniae]|nr:calcium/proton exchanger [Klebsiella pneumoniae]
MISALMATGDAAPTLMRDTLYSIIMIVTGGLVGFSLLLGGRKFATQYMNLFGIKQYLIALFPLAIIVLVFPMALPGANFQHRAIAAGGGNFGGHVRRFPAYSDQNPSEPVCL